MRCKILHETTGRMRIHICQPGMTTTQADCWEAYLNENRSVLKAKVNERTGNALVCYHTGERKTILSLFAKFDYQEALKLSPVQASSSRKLNREFVDKLFNRIAGRGMTFLLPSPVRLLITAAKAIPYFRKALNSLWERKLEVSVLDGVSIGISMLRGEWNTAGNVMFLLGIGDLMEEWTHKKSVADLAEAMSLHVDRVWLRNPDGKETFVGISRIREGDEIVVRTGNLIPLDGIVAEGDGMVNQASMTGESLPAHKKTGSMVYAGTVVEEGKLIVQVTHATGEGRYDRIVKMIEESEKLKSRTEAKASHLADQLVPWTLGATLLTLMITRSSARAAAILMVDFCCALKLSMPISILSAMREAGNQSITVKGGIALENYSEADVIVFDKTGTLTSAVPIVHSVEAFNGCTPKEALRLAACLEEHYPHSMANAVVEEAMRQGLEHEERHSAVEYIVAHGIASSIDGKKVRIGSSHFIFKDEGAVITEEDQHRFESLPDEYSHLYMCIDGVLSAVILIEDPLKGESAEVLRKLHDLGISRLVMLTGDGKRTARSVAQRAGIDEYHAEMLPENKAAFIIAEREAGRKVVMIGDGVNDTLALSEADCGVAVNSGAAIAREVADITILEDNLWSLVTLKQISDCLMNRIHNNYLTILSFNTLLIVMALFGMISSGTTALLHNLSTIAISLNSMTNLLPES